MADTQSNLEIEFENIEKVRQKVLEDAKKLTDNFKNLKIKTLLSGKIISLTVRPTIGKSCISILLTRPQATITPNTDFGDRTFYFNLNEIDEILDALKEIKEVSCMSIDEFNSYSIQRKVLEKL